MKRPRNSTIAWTIAAMLLGPEAKEAFTAFFEKRKPDFSKVD